MTTKRVKRQHPTDPDLFWCPKCSQYKKRGEFLKSKQTKCGLYGHCKRCCAVLRIISNRKNKETVNKRNREWRKTEKARASVAAYRSLKKDELRVWYKKRELNERLTASNQYIKRILKQRRGAIITPEIIELARGRLMLHRTLKEFKQCVSAMG